MTHRDPAKAPMQLLIVEDSKADAMVLRGMIEDGWSGPVEFVHVSTADEADAELAERSFDCVLLDYRLGDRSGLDVIRKTRAAGSDVPIVTISGSGNEAVAVEAMRTGAQDYIVKGSFSTASLVQSIQNALDTSENERRQRDANRELREFARVAAHDLRAPIRHIEQFAALLEESLTDGASEFNVDCLKRIRSTASRMNGLLTSLMNFVKAGRSDAAFGPVDLTRVVETVLEALEAAPGEPAAEVRHGSLPVVRGEVTGLTQLFENVIGNAIKFCTDGTPRIEIDATEDGDTVRISVRDHGVGIDAADCADAMKPFKRVASSVGFEGSGLGLAICKRIVDQHGGEISIGPAEGGGAIVSFSLPRELVNAT